MMHILIADDEAPARNELHFMLADLLPEATFHLAANGEEALHHIEAQRVDLVFLDIHMPGPDGLAVAATIAEGPEPPLFVFATAFDQHAVHAFKLAALDYIVKPIDEERLAVTVARARQALDERATRERREAALHEFLRGAAPCPGLNRLWAQRDNENWILLSYGDILWLAAEDKRVYAQTTAGEKLLVRQTLKELEARLAAEHFARLHHAYLVNLDHVAEVVPWFSGAYEVRMDDATHSRIPMSRRYAAHLKQLTGWR